MTNDFYFDWFSPHVSLFFFLSSIGSVRCPSPSLWSISNLSSGIYRLLSIRLIKPKRPHHYYGDVSRRISCNYNNLIASCHGMDTMLSLVMTMALFEREEWGEPGDRLWITGGTSRLRLRPAMRLKDFLCESATRHSTKGRLVRWLILIPTTRLISIQN
jgi:hypothetical protein